MPTTKAGKSARVVLHFSLGFISNLHQLDLDQSHVLSLSSSVHHLLGDHLESGNGLRSEST
jgi:hypothetical protein